MILQGGKLTIEDRIVLYDYIQAFFIQGDKITMNQLLQKCHESCENMESDLRCRKIDQSGYHKFGAQHDLIEEFEEKLAMSKGSIESERIKIWHS